MLQPTFIQVNDQRHIRQSNSISSKYISILQVQRTTMYCLDTLVLKVFIKDFKSVCTMVSQAHHQSATYHKLVAVSGSLFFELSFLQDIGSTSVPWIGIFVPRIVRPVPSRYNAILERKTTTSVLHQMGGGNCTHGQGDNGSFQHD
jgi:hypothetical protein